MWFRKEDRPEPEPAQRVDAHRDGSLAAAPFAVEGAARRETSHAPHEAAIPPHDLHVRNPPAAKFQPNWRKLKRGRVTGPGAPAEVCSAYNVLRTRIVNALHQNGWSTIAVTSPTRQSGNTLTAINLAISLARDFNHTVLLVELDLINPAFHRVLGFGQRRGVSDYLLHDAPLSELPLDIGVDRLLLIPAGSPVANSAELLFSPRMARFMDELKRRFARQIILFDLPSVLAFDDAMTFAPLVDCALLVVEEGTTKVEDVQRARARLEPAKVLGVVLNRSIARSGGALRSEA